MRVLVERFRLSLSVVVEIVLAVVSVLSLVVVAGAVAMVVIAVVVSLYRFPFLCHWRRTGCCCRCRRHSWSGRFCHLHCRRGGTLHYWLEVLVLSLLVSSAEGIVVIVKQVHELAASAHDSSSPCC